MESNLAGSDTPIALVYLGKKVPKYLYSNLLYLRRKFSNPIILLLDNHIGSQEAQFLSENGIRVQTLDNSVTDKFIIDPNRILVREGFWLKTINRFVALRQIFYFLGFDELLHIEADVLLSPNFPWSAFARVEKHILFPQVDEYRASGAIVFARGKEIYDEFIGFLYTELIKYPNLTDMQLLKRYSQNFPQIYGELPTIFDSQRGTQFPDTSGIFDAAPWGQFLFGTDPNMSAGISRRYVRKLGYSFEPSDFIVEIDSMERIQVLKDNRRTYLFNLHIHSKSASIFRDDSRRFEMLSKKQVAYDQVSFNVPVFVKSIWKLTKNYLSRTQRRLIANIGRLIKRLDKR